MVTYNSCVPGISIYTYVLVRIWSIPYELCSVYVHACTQDGVVGNVAITHRLVYPGDKPRRRPMFKRTVRTEEGERKEERRSSAAVYYRY